MTLATLIQYVLQVAAARRLPTGDFGAFGSLVALTVVGAVPLFAVQAVTARRIAGSRDAGPRTRIGTGIGIGMVGPALRCGCLVAAVAAVMAVPVASFLHLPLAAALLMAPALAPLPLVGAALGSAQGERRHRDFIVLYVAYSLTRLVFVVAALWALPTTTSAMAGLAVGSLATGALGWWILHRHGTGVTQVAPSRFGRDVLFTSLALLSVLVLASTDLLVARHRLSAADSDLYALGSLAARAVFWLLQFAAVAAYADLASRAPAARRRATLLSGFALILVLGALGAAVAAVLPARVVTTMIGPQYAAVVALLPLFAVLGSALAAAQYLLMAGVARGRWRGGAVLAVAAAVEAAALLLMSGPTVARLAAMATLVTSLAVVVLLVSDLRLLTARTAAVAGPPRGLEHW